MKNNVYLRIVKPVLDICFSLGLLIIVSPLIVFCIILLIIANGKHIFFIQSRPGYKEELFKIIKFRTMNDKRDINGELLPDEQRLTYIGKIIRQFSIDELLQLINVIKGDMSLIGPRPLLTEYLPLYNESQKKRHNVKPGITGWALVNGRNTLSWEDKFNLDVWYVDNISFKLDVKIFFLTIKKIFIAEGISSGTSATMEKFMGTKEC